MRKPTVPEVVPLVHALYARSCVGGPLHIVLDDENVDRSDVLFCIRQAQSEGDKEAEHLGRLLLRMSKTQRLKLANTWGPRPECSCSFCMEHYA